MENSMPIYSVNEYYGINGDTPGEQDSSPTTILSRQFDGTQSLFEVAARLADGKELLSDALTTIINKNTSTKMSNLAIRVIRKSVLPLMDIASTLTRTSANMVGPIAGGNYAHKREEVSRKKMIKLSKVTENAGLVMVNELVNGHSPPAPDKRVQPKRKVSSLHDTLPTPTPPANGVEYGVGEFLSIIQVYKKGSRARGGMIKSMMSPQYSYLNQSQRAVYNIIQEHEKGQMFDFDETWHDNGRPPTCLRGINLQAKRVKRLTETP